VILLLVGILLFGISASYFVVRFYFPTFHAIIWTRNNEEKQHLTKKKKHDNFEESGPVPEKVQPTNNNQPQDKVQVVEDTSYTHISGRSSPGSTGSEYEPGYNLPRAASTDSLASDTSVLELLPDLSKIGQIEVGFDYDRDASELVLSVIQARDLCTGNEMDHYVNIYVYPDAANMRSQTKVQKKDPSPIFKERFLYSIEPHEIPVKVVQFQVFSIDKYARHKHAGEAEVRLADVDLIRPLRLWLNLREMDERPSEFGELMFSMSYLPTAERLTVVVVKAKGLKWYRSQRNFGDAFVKVHLTQSGKRIAKKKTSVKRGESHPTFNEAMIFSLPQTALNNVQLRLTVAEVVDNEKIVSIGHVIVGANTGGTELTHWQQMISSLRKPIAMWHYLRKQESKKKEPVAGAS